MDPEDQKKLDRLLKLAEENNDYIRKVRSAQKTSQMFRAIKWVIGIVVLVAAYYAVQPYISTIKSLYASMHSSSASASNPSELTKLMDSLKGDK